MTRDELVATLRTAGCVWAEDEADVLLATPERDLATMLTARVAGAPLEQVVGWAGFCGLVIQLDSGVFVPRRRTQVLAYEAVRLATEGCIAVDLCCGSGAVAAVLTMARCEVHASDVDPAAVACARRNAPRVYAGDLFAALPSTLRGQVAVLVANVPYVPSDAVLLLPSEARDHEPLPALDGGPDGLDVFRRVVTEAPAWLAPGGSLLSEVSEEQASEALAVLAEAGLDGRLVVDEDLEATVVVGVRSH